MMMTMFYKCELSTPFELDEALLIIVLYCYLSLMYFNNLKHAVCIALINHIILTNNNSLTNIIKNNNSNDNINIGDPELDSFT